MKHYDDLPVIEGTEEHHCWNEFGPGDELGSLNRITPEKVVEAAALVRRGATFSLDLRLDQPGALSDIRPTYSHSVMVAEYGRDDSLDGFYLSASSQWDGLRHVRYRQHGYYGGRQEHDLDSTGALGIDGITGKGFVTRGVLLDIAGYMAVTGQHWDPLAKVRIQPEVLDAVLAHQSCDIGEGDVLLLRTGWLDAWMALPADRRASGPGANPGLDPGRPTAQWLWDRGVVAVAADNVAVEPIPYNERGDGHLHFRLLPLLGILMGEQFALDDVAADCAADGVYEGLFVSSPLRVPSGVCSPPNAYLVK
jgi:kynurenine formamidase